MVQDPQRNPTIHINGQPMALKILQPQQVAMIDEALSCVDEFGEVRLVVEKRRLRFIVTQKSYDAFKLRPGDLTGSQE